MDPEPQIELVLDLRCTIGESPLWSPEEAALWFIDVKAPCLYRYHPASGALRRWPVSSDLGAFTLLPGSPTRAALVALRNGLHRLDLETGSLQLLSPPPFDPARFRFNEGMCDAQGRFWVGVMFDPLDPADTDAATGPLCRYTSAEGLSVAQDGAELHNGMAVSADGSQLYLSHSNTGAICRYRLGPRGHLHDPTLLATVHPADGIPDGAALDEAGFYWSALHGGGRLRRYGPDGTPEREIALPVSQPTAPAFAGPGMDVMYLTSARNGLSPEALRNEPAAGGLFRLRPGPRGLPRRTTLA